MQRQKSNTTGDLSPMQYSTEQLQKLPEHLLLKYTLIHYELQFPAEKPEAAIAQIVGVSEACIDNYKIGKGCLSRFAWKAIYAYTGFELIRDWDVANRIGA